MLKFVRFFIFVLYAVSCFTVGMAVSFIIGDDNSFLFAALATAVTFTVIMLPVLISLYFPTVFRSNKEIAKLKEDLISDTANARQRAQEWLNLSMELSRLLVSVKLNSKQAKDAANLPEKDSDKLSFKENTTKL